MERRPTHKANVALDIALKGLGINMLSIHSTSSGRELCIRRGHDGYFLAELQGHHVTALAEVWIDDDPQSLGRFLSELGDLDHPWVGQREWSSLEGDLVFAITCTSLGAVTFNVQLAGFTGAPEEWHVAVGIETEFGQLTRIGLQAKELLDTTAVR